MMVRRFVALTSILLSVCHGFQPLSMQKRFPVARRRKWVGVRRADVRSSAPGTDPSSNGGTGVVKHFINLTNGIEALALLEAAGVCDAGEVNFCRIQSSHCEANDYAKVESRPCSCRASPRKHLGTLHLSRCGDPPPPAEFIFL